MPDKSWQGCILQLEYRSRHYLTPQIHEFFVAFNLRVRDGMDQTSMINQLADRTCNEAGPQMKRLTPTGIKSLKKYLGSGWKLVKGKTLEKSFKFQDFKSALAYTVQVGNLAENVGHHPDILLTYGAVRLQIFTHSAKGLTENDFILAAKIERI